MKYKKIIAISIMFLLSIGLTLMVGNLLEKKLYAQETKSYEKVCFSLIDEGEDFEEVPSLAKNNILVFKEKSKKGFVVFNELDTVKGKIEIAVAINSSGIISGVKVINQEYSLGEGTDIADEGYLSSYIGKSRLSKNISNDEKIKPLPGEAELSETIYNGVRESLKIVGGYIHEKK